MRRTNDFGEAKILEKDFTQKEDKQDTFISVCKLLSWLLFFIVIDAVFTTTATKKLFENHTESIGMLNSYSYSDFVSDGFVYAFLYTMLVIFVLLSVTYTLKYILHCNIDCTPLTAASCFVFIFYAAACILLQISVSLFDYSPITDAIGAVIEQEECEHSDFDWVTNTDSQYFAHYKNFDIAPGHYKFICSHCEKVFESGYAIKVKGTEDTYDLLDARFVADPISLTYEHRTHKHNVADKYDCQLPTT